MRTIKNWIWAILFALILLDIWEPETIFENIMFFAALVMYIVHLTLFAFWDLDDNIEENDK